MPLNKRRSSPLELLSLVRHRIMSTLSASNNYSSFVTGSFSSSTPSVGTSGTDLRTNLGQTDASRCLVYDRSSSGSLRALFIVDPSVAGEGVLCGPYSESVAKDIDATAQGKYFFESATCPAEPASDRKSLSEGGDSCPAEHASNRNSLPKAQGRPKKPTKNSKKSLMPHEKPEGR